MSAYGEADIPLLARRGDSAGQLLSLQVSGRTERYEVDTGTPTASVASNGTISYGTPNLNGAPYAAQATYTSTNATVGLKYQPVTSLTLRMSYATAFLPPSPSQLVTNPQPGTFLPTISDPRTNTSYPVATLSGGNPALKPEHSQSWNAGVIWEPSAPWARGLRFNLEYYRIVQLDKIGSLSAQQIVNSEDDYPGRVTRNAGLVTLVDTSLLNLTRYETEGLDLSADFRTATALGTFDLRIAGTYILHEKRQTAINSPLLDYAGYVPEGGPAKLKANATLGWEKGPWTAGWTARYFSSYWQYGAAGGPDSIQFFGGLPDTFLLLPQGGDTIPAQVYHDVFLGWRHTRTDRVALGFRMLEGLSVQVGVKNVFGTLPPFQAGSPYLMSPYGDIRLCTYWLSVKKLF
jgi:outer membrane receptor protein involved in Fe transport